MEYLGERKEINQIEPVVSVCVPTFEHAPYISECLTSILSQKTNFPYEILVGEDGSTDGTREICKAFAEENQDKIRLFLRDPNEKMFRNGKKVGRKNHLELYKSARGKFVCICDGDDYWLNENKLQIQVDYLINNPESSMCIGRTVVEKNEPTLQVDWPEKVKLLGSKELKLTYYLGHVSSWMLRNHMEEFVNNKAAILCPGLDLVIFSFYKSKGRIIQCPEILSFYRFNPKGSLRKLSAREKRKKLWQVNWYLYRYVHRSKFVFIRSVFYFTRRNIINMLKRSEK
jgi:glycosyltransferase involved in cell wall biosynthesis